jgi:nicotinate-nucleotide pyrophosphorylase (carboxylating)
VHRYLADKSKVLKIEIECRTFKELEEILAIGGIDRIMLDNFSPENAAKAVQMIDKRFETEISGGIDLTTIYAYGQCGADFISVGALTHSYTSLDLSLKALS